VYGVPDDVAMKTIHQKRRTFSIVSALLIFLIAVALIVAGIFLYTFWLRIIFAIIVIGVACTTFSSINRIYIKSITLNRDIYIQSLFPIKERLTRQQSQFILTDLGYLFENNSDTEDPLNTLYKKIKTNNLSAKDIEKLNMLYSKDFIDLTVMKRR
jgi:hypothetical protein